MSITYIFILCKRYIFFSFNYPNLKWKPEDFAHCCLYYNNPNYSSKLWKEKRLLYKYNSFLHVYFLKIIAKHSCEDDNLGKNTDQCQDKTKARSRTFGNKQGQRHYLASSSYLQRNVFLFQMKADASAVELNRFLSL